MLESTLATSPGDDTPPPVSDTAQGLAFFRDYQPAAGDLAADVLAGLSQPQKTLPPKYFYDARGSHLFDRITELPEYYVPRAEIGLLRRIGPELADHVGPHANVIEYGSGASTKIRLLLDALDRPHLYVGVDISRAHLLTACARLAADYPHLQVGAICADFTRPFDLPERELGTRWRVGFFPGSTIGNFAPDEAVAVLRAMRAELRSEDSLLIGVDLRKDEARLLAAYDDAQGVTAAFNLNLIARINRELSAGIPLDGFAHHVRYDAQKGRVEMHLRALRRLEFSICGRTFLMERDETIHTENSHKYTREGFDDLAAAAGFRPHRYWTDPGGLFSVRLMRAV